jgi:hypothetical protein
VGTAISYFNGNIQLGASVVLADSNNLTTLKPVGVGSAVNFLQVTNSATLGNIIIESTGSDTNVGMDLKTKGTGLIKANSLAGTGTRMVVANSGGTLTTAELSQTIIITTSGSVTTATTGDTGLSQNGCNVIISNGVNNINYTINTAITVSFVKDGTGTITFIQGSGRTLVLVDGTAVLNGIPGSTATITSLGTKDYLRISNA